MSRELKFSFEIHKSLDDYLQYIFDYPKDEIERQKWFNITVDIISKGISNEIEREKLNESKN